MPTEAKTAQGPINPGWFAVALQILVLLEHSDGVCPSGELAEQIGSHAVFLRRVAAHLVRAGMLEAREGREGGYRLSQPADQVTLADIYRALKHTGSAALIPLEPAAGLTLAPGLRSVMGEINSEIEDQLLAVLSRRTLADLIQRAAALNTP